MSAEELSSHTVIELRKMAREAGIPLRAGISKAGIVECLSKAFAERDAASDERQVTIDEAMTGAVSGDSKQNAPAAVPAAPAPKPASPATSAAAPAASAPAQPVARPAAQGAAGGALQFKRAWQNPVSPYGSRSASSTPRSTPQSSWGTAGRPLQQQDPAPRTGTVRPVGYTPRFGPGAVQEPANQPSEGYRGLRRNDPPVQRPAYGAEHPPMNQGANPDEQLSDAARAAYNQRAAYEGYQPDPNVSQPTQAELMASLDCADGSGIL